MQAILDQATLTMTYADLAERFQLSVAGARGRAKRQGWRSEIAEDGKARVYVPITALEPGEQNRPPLDDTLTLGPEMVMTSAEPVEAIDPLSPVSDDPFVLINHKLQGLESQLQTWQQRAVEIQSTLDIARERADAAREAAAQARTDVLRLEGELLEHSRPWWKRVFDYRMG